MLVAGGGIGGIAAALAMTRPGFAVNVLEPAAQFGEIDAGSQLGPNGFAAFDAPGIGEIACVPTVHTDENEQRGSGHVDYRAVVDRRDCPADVQERGVREGGCGEVQGCFEVCEARVKRANISLE